MPQPLFEVFLDWDPHPAIVAAQFVAAERAMQDLNPPLERAIREVVAPSFAENFEVGGRPKWTPLADVTLEKRARNNTGFRILDETGTLKGMASSVGIWSIHDNEAFLMASQLGDAEYGTYHQSGTSKMPERPWAVLQPKDEDDITEILGDHAVETIVDHVSIINVVGGFVRRVFRR